MNPRRKDDRASDQRNPHPPGLPLRGSGRTPRRVILASHLVFTGYAHWFPNDLRGSGSTEIRKGPIADLRGLNLVPADHPVWSNRPYKVFLYSESDVTGRIDYVNENPLKEGLPRQHWPFVQECPFTREGQA